MNQNGVAQRSHASSSSSDSSLVQQLQAVLEHQLELACRGELEGVPELQEDVDRLLDAIRPQALLSSDAGGVKRIKELHNALALTLAAQRVELADMLARMRQGRKTLKAYRLGR